MSRYVFLNSEVQDVKVLAAARKAARSRGATVVKSLAGTMLLELAPGAGNRGGAGPAGLALLGRAQDDQGARAQASGAHQGTGRAGGCRQGIDQGLRRIGGAEDFTTLPPIKLMSTSADGSVFEKGADPRPQSRVAIHTKR
jgi:hypothetical protein